MGAVRNDGISNAPILVHTLRCSLHPSTGAQDGGLEQQRLSAHRGGALHRLRVVVVVARSIPVLVTEKEFTFEFTFTLTLTFTNTAVERCPKFRRTTSERGHPLRWG